MAKINFTVGRVADFKCEPGKGQSFLWDTGAPGLGLRATASGAKAFMFQAKLNGQTIRITIGDPGTWPIDAPTDGRGRPTGNGARQEARRLKTLIDEGKDPRRVRAEALESELAAQEAKRVAADALAFQQRREETTLGMVWPLYIDARRNAKRKGGKQGWSEWHVRDHENVARIGGVPKKRGKGLTEPGPLASLLAVRLCELTGERIAAWLSSEAQARPTQTALAYRLLSVFMNWCEGEDEYRGLVPSGACKARQVKDEVPSVGTKDGDSLQREQLAAWFGAVRSMSNIVQSAYLQTLLLTGARRRELSSLRWCDVDFVWRSLTIRDKVEGERVVPLCPYVASLLNALPRRNEWVFSSPASENGQLAEPTPGHKRALVAAALPDLTLHGLRRSFGSLAEWTEMPAGVVAQIMGHKPSAIAEKHYRRRPLDLLRMWHTKLETWILAQAGVEVAANNITPLRLAVGGAS